MVDDGRVRRQEQHARQLGFTDLRGYLQTRCDAGYSVPALAQELAVSQWTIAQTLATLGIVLAPRPQRLARQRRRFTAERIATLVADLGFADVEAYLQDRLIRREWLLADVAVELGAHGQTVRHLMEQAGVRRVRRTARQLVAGRRGRQLQSLGWCCRQVCLVIVRRNCVGMVRQHLVGRATDAAAPTGVGAVVAVMVVSRG